MGGVAYQSLAYVIEGKNNNTCFKLLKYPPKDNFQRWSFNSLTN